MASPEISEGDTISALEALSILEQNYGIIPAKGRLTPLRTRAETLAQDQTVDIFICEVQQKFTQKLVTAIKEIPDGNAVPLMHLRRVVQKTQVPGMTQASPSNETSDENPSRSRSQSGGRRRRPSSGSRAREEPKLLALCPTSLIAEADLVTLLTTVLQESLDADQPVELPVLQLHTVPVPRYPPASLEQSKEYTQKYWPTIFMNSNPFGPHPRIFTVAQAEMDRTFDYYDQTVAKSDMTLTGVYMSLARRVAMAAQAKNIGLPIGVVVVERSKESQEVIAVAGDARYEMSGFSESNSQSTQWGPGCMGNPGAHAVMRAISLVAGKRRRIAALSAGKEPAAYQTSIFKEEPILPEEQEVFKADNLKPGGYLCLNLELYITHEPCVMCSMALVHSRFGRVIFERGPLTTGGLHFDDVRLEAEDSGYGLWWREDLNWKFLCWQWNSEDEAETQQDKLQISRDTHA